MSKVRLSLVTENNDYPLLLSFPMGIPEQVDEMNLALAKKDGRSVKTQVVGELKQVVYRGSDFGDNSTSKNGNKYAVGIYNEETKTIRLVPTEHIFPMRPTIESKILPMRNSSFSSLERRERLTGEFGSTKKKRALAAAQGNIILTDNISGASAIETVMSKRSSVKKEKKRKTSSATD